MTVLIFILLTIMLLAGFVAMTVYETEHGVRFFAARRAWLDEQIGRITFVIERVDLAAFVRDAGYHFAQRVGHDIVHLSLQAVRAVERLLTRLVRHFRVQQASVAPRENVREFVKTLSDFKEQLKATAPEVTEIQGENGIR